jgi:MFS family permease
LLLQSGQVVSYIGNQQQFIALPLLVLALTGSAVQAGFAVSLNTIAVLIVSPLAGALADLWNRKAIMLACDAGQGIILLTIPLAYWLDRLTMTHLYIAVTLAGALGTLFRVANAAALPNIVPPEQLPEALAQSQAAFSGVRTFGALLGGTLYTIGAAFPFLVNALSFGASVLSLSWIRADFQRRREATAGMPLHRSIAEGFQWLWRQPLLRFLTAIEGGDALRYGAGYLVILVLAQELDAGAREIGAIFTGAAIGALIGNLASSRVRERVRFGRIAITMLWVEALMFPLYAVAPGWIFMGLIAAAEELVAPMYAVPFNSYRIMATPDAMQGRTSSTTQLVRQGGQSLGAILGGVMIAGVGASWSAVILGGWLALLAIATTLNRQVRSATLPVDAAALAGD